MASKGGPMAAGTDGNDFQHRERVAPQYRASATNKSRVKYISILHIMMLLIMTLRLSVGLCVILGIRPPGMLQRLRLPKPQIWEYIWLCSLLPCIMGLMSLKRNNLFYIRQYILGTITFGLVPVIYAIIDNLDELMDYWQTKSATLLFRGFPMVVLWNMFLTIALQLHGFSIYFAWQLSKAWKPHQKKKAT